MPLATLKKGSRKKFRTVQKGNWGESVCKDEGRENEHWPYDMLNSQLTCMLLMYEKECDVATSRYMKRAMHSEPILSHAYSATLWQKSFRSSQRRTNKMKSTCAVVNCLAIAATLPDILREDHDYGTGFLA